MLNLSNPRRRSSRPYRGRHQPPSQHEHRLREKRSAFPGRQGRPAAIPLGGGRTDSDIALPCDEV